MFANFMSEVEKVADTITPGNYQGTITRSQLVLTRSNACNHVITFRPDRTSSNDAQPNIDQWIKLGTGAEKDEEGRILAPESFEMSASAKLFYKQRLNQLGVTDIAKFEPQQLVGTRVMFTVEPNERAEFGPKIASARKLPAEVQEEDMAASVDRF